MTYTLDLTEKEGVVHAVLVGVRTPEGLAEATEKATSFCLERSTFEVLVDVRAMTGRLDTLQTYDIAGQRLPYRNDVRLLRAAVLDHPENLDRVRFFETVATNRGVNVKIFDDKTRALAWLRDDGC
jgi:hypothetical protein